jgi:hypothetical protein
VTFHLNSGLFGVGRADQIQIDPSFNIDRSLAANNSGRQEEHLP